MASSIAQLNEIILTELAKFPLSKAASKGEKDQVIALVESGHSVNAKDRRGFSALHYSVFGGRVEMVELLVQLGADMTSVDVFGMDPFFLAATSEHYDIVKCLARRGANPSTYDRFGATPLHRAANMNMLEMAKLLIEVGADVSLIGDNMLGVPPLRSALASNNIEMMELLAKLGADVNQKDKIGMNAVVAAANDSRLEALECLVRLGADLDAAAPYPPLTFSVNLGHANVVDVLVRNGAKLNRSDWPWPLLIRTITNHDETTMALLLDGGMNPDLERSYGMTPLYGTAANMLINAGADVNFTNPLGMNSLHGSCMYGQTDMVRLLLLAGADIKKADAKGKMPLEYLPFRHLVDYSLEARWMTSEKPAEGVDLDTLPDVICPPLEALHTIPGLGDVFAIPDGLAKRVFADVRGVIEKLPTLPSQLFTGAKVQQVGSSAEETRTGLPNEMDYIFQVDLGLDNSAVKEVGFGYALFSYPNTAEKAYAFVVGSKSFHDIFGDLFQKFNEISEGTKITFMEGTQEVVKETDRKACTPMMLCWTDDDGDNKVAVSVDAVPCIHINDWPEQGTRRTWLMDYEQLKERGYNLIPKPPNTLSEVARGFDPKQLREIWRISFSHLETEHMYNVPPRVKAVYITAKCLRNPDVCQILIRDKGGKLKTAESYVVSYILKMMFFQRAEEFINTDQSLGKMVCQLFDDVVDGLTNNFVPLFFIPTVNVIDGLKLDVAKCATVARIMSRFVKALYQRDLDPDGEGAVDSALTVYQRDKALYKVYDVREIGRVTDDTQEQLQMLNIDGATAEKAEGGAAEEMDDEEPDAMFAMLSKMATAMNDVTMSPAASTCLLQSAKKDSENIDKQSKRFWKEYKVSKDTGAGQGEVDGQT